VGAGLAAAGHDAQDLCDPSYRSSRQVGAACGRRSGCLPGTPRAVRAAARLVQPAGPVQAEGCCPSRDVNPGTIFLVAGQTTGTRGGRCSRALKSSGQNRSARGRI